MATALGCALIAGAPELVRAAGETDIATGETDIATSEMGVVTNDPTGTDSSEWAISRRLKQLINGAPAGSHIRIAQYRMLSGEGETDPVVPALIRAFERGVHVKIVLDKSEDHNPTPFNASPGLAELRDKIARKYGGESGDIQNNSFIRLCGPRPESTTLVQEGPGGCIGKAVQHNKFYLFSESGGRSKVVVQSTANIEDANSESYWNAAYIVAGRETLYDGYLEYFRDLASKVQNLNYYRTVTDGNLKAYFFPRPSSTGDSDDPSTDTIINILDNVKCTGNSTVGTSTNHRTIIRVAVWGFTREKVAHKLRELANDDCWIDVAINGVENTDEVSNKVKRALRGCPPEAPCPREDRHPRINVDDPFASGHLMHAKYLLVEGNYNGSSDTKVAWLGSHNFTINALRNSDEAWLKIDSDTAHDALRTQFRRIMEVSPNFEF